MESRISRVSLVVFASAVLAACAGRSGPLPDAGQPDGATTDAFVPAPSDAGVDAAPGVCASGAENTAAACSDGCSNDDDMFVDCEDRDCCDVVSCGPGTFCGGQDMCAPGPENTPAACSDGCSNDGDAFVDCDDRDCCDVVSGCSADTFCGTASGGEDTVEACRNGSDDDGDGSSDCGDVSCCGVLTDCPPRSGCNPTGTSTCNAGIGEATFESGLTSFSVSTIHDADRVEFEGGGIRFWWPARDLASYTTMDCSAITSSTAAVANCMGVRVLEQTWADESTGACGRIRGRVWGTRPSGGSGFSIDFVSPVRLRASQIDFAP